MAPSVNAGDVGGSPLGMKGDAASPMVQAMMHGKPRVAEKAPRGAKHKLHVKPGRTTRRITRSMLASEKEQGMDMHDLFNHVIPPENGKATVAALEHIQREALKYEEGRKISSKHRSEKNEETKWRNKMAVQPGTKPDRVHKLKEIRQPPNRGLAKGQPRELREVSKGFKPMPSNK